MPTTQPREITESFRLERVLKSSRSAIVFRAADPGTGRTVAIKLIPPASPATLPACQERFMAAMAVLASVAPATFPALLDHGFTPDGSAFMVMEFVEGERLDALIGAAPARILGLALEVAQGLDALARAGVSHGNLSPENIVSHRRAGVEHVSILGFGTAAFHAGARAAGETAPPSGAGRFVAPERRGGAAAADWRADLYALAATCCALLRAEAPGDDAPTVTLPQAVAQRIPEPTALEAVLGQALRADPAARPASLEAFRQAIVTSLSGAGLRTVAAVAIPAATPHVDGQASGAQPEPPAVAPQPIRAPDAGEDTAPARVVPIFLRPEAVPAGGNGTGPVPVEQPTELPAHPQADGAVAAEPLCATGPPSDSAAAAPPAVAAPGDQPRAEPAPNAAASAPRTARRRAAPWAAVAGAIVVVAAAVGAAWYASTRPGGTLRIAVPTPAPRRPTPVPSLMEAHSAAVQLQMVEAAIALDDLPGALAHLDAISPTELAGLTPAEQERFKELRGAYLAKRQRAVKGEVQAALAAGNMTALAGTLRRLSRAEEASFPRDRDFIATLEDARRALDVHAALLKAQRQGELGEVVRDAGVLLGLSPRCAQAAQMRVQAATALERDADTFAAAGNYEAALAALATLHDAWNDRPGLADRIERLRGEQAAERRFAAAMAQVEQSERDRAPENGLALLRAMPADPKTRARVEQARERLAKQLEQLDAAPPSVALAQGVKLEYKKGASATIALRIRDDHRVKGARFFARAEGAAEFVELPMRRGSGEDWSVEISPEFHHNQTVEFYVTASDYSGHTAQLGSARDPLKLKRKRNWLGF
jgi:hypothetical protein